MKSSDRDVPTPATGCLPDACRTHISISVPPLVIGKCPGEEILLSRLQLRLHAACIESSSSFHTARSVVSPAQSRQQSQQFLQAGILPPPLVLLYCAEGEVRAFCNVNTLQALDLGGLYSPQSVSFFFLDMNGPSAAD